MLKKITTLSVLILLGTICESQEIQGYEPYTMIGTDSSLHIERYDTKLDQELDSIQEYKSDFEEILRSRNQYLKSKLLNQHFIQNEQLTSYFDFILEEICSNNDELNKNEITLFIARYPWENATCYNEGTIVFNLGLYRKLENESQIAMILAHELAHYYLRHGNISLTEHVKKINSEAFKKEVEKIQEYKYNQRERLIKLFKDITYNDKRHSRDYEVESDSMALMFLANTRYNLESAIEVIGLLDSIDEDKYDHEIDYDQFFNFEAYPFKKSWLSKKNESIFGAPVKTEHVEGFNRDSLKTHPNCLERFEVLQKQLAQYRNDSRNVFLQDSSLFAQLIYESDFEYVTSYIANQQLGRGLFYGLKLEYHNPNNAFLVNLIGNSFYHFYLAQSENELGKYVELEAPHFSKGYKQFLTFIHNLRLTDYKMIGYYFMEERYDQLKDNENFLYQFILNASLLEDKTRYKDLVAEYKKSFPQGEHLRVIITKN